VSELSKALNDDCLKGPVTEKIDEQIKKYYDHIKRTWKTENDEERTMKGNEWSIQNKRNQRVRMVHTYSSWEGW